MEKLAHRYKLIYADTNVISDICKDNKLMMTFINMFSSNENLLCFSTYTLYEVSRNDELYIAFKKFYAIFPCVIVVSYFPLWQKEFEFHFGDESDIDIVLHSPHGIRIDGKPLSPDSLDELMSQPQVIDGLKNVSNYIELFYNEYKSLLDEKEFSDIKNKEFKLNQFIAPFKNYELRMRCFGGNPLGRKMDMKLVNKIKSLEVLAQGVCFKFYSDKQRKVSKSDIIDILIMTTFPYVDTFVSEGNCIDICKKINRSNRSNISTKLMTLSELRSRIKLN